MSYRVKVDKARLVQLLEKHEGQAVLVGRELKCSYRTVLRRIKEFELEELHKDLQRQLDESIVAEARHGLIEGIRAGNATLIIFALKVKGGWIETEKHLHGWDQEQPVALEINGELPRGWAKGGDSD